MISPQIPDGLMMTHSEYISKVFFLLAHLSIKAKNFALWPHIFFRPNLSLIDSLFMACLEG